MSRAERKGIPKSRPARTYELGYYVIVTDTIETEANYLRGFRDWIDRSQRGRIVIKMLRSNTKELISVCKTMVT